MKVYKHGIYDYITAKKAVREGIVIKWTNQETESKGGYYQ